MGEEWKALARRAPEFLHPLHAADEHAVQSRLPTLISAASDALNLRRGNLAQYRAGVGHIADPLQQPVLPSTPLDQAISMLGEHHQIHTAGARFLALYGEHLAFLLPAEAARRDLVLLPRVEQLTHACWEQWLVNRAEAMDRKRDVSRKLRLAAAYDIACYDAVSVAGMLPAGSPLWQRRAWVQAAESHAARAHHQATAAAEDARQMSANAYLESWYATAILVCT